MTELNCADCRASLSLQTGVAVKEFSDYEAGKLSDGRGKIMVTILAKQICVPIKVKYSLEE